MKRLALALALAGACTIAMPAVTPAFALETFGPKELRPGQYLWRDAHDAVGPQRVVVSLSDQLAYFYRGNALVAVSTISSGKDEKPTPTGIFSVLDKRPMYRSKKYDNAPMPWMQRIDQYGVALHAGYNPGTPASHGCVRLPAAFAKKLYSVTDVGTPVYIGA